MTDTTLVITAPQTASIMLTSAILTYMVMVMLFGGRQ